MKQGEETVRQGKAIMVFTVMTIVFVSAPSIYLLTYFNQLTRHNIVTPVVHEQSLRHERRRTYWK